MKLQTWSVAEAKAKLSEVIEKARAGKPQLITRHGKTAVVVVSAEEWDRRTKPRETLAEFFARSPLADSEIEIERMKGGWRDVDL